MPGDSHCRRRIDDILFVGLDLSQKMTAICVIDNAGRRLRIGSFAHNQAHCRIMAQASGIIHRLLLLLRCTPLLFLGRRTRFAGLPNFSMRALCGARRCKARLFRESDVGVAAFIGLPQHLLGKSQRRGRPKRRAPQGAKLIEAERPQAVNLSLDSLAIKC